MAKFTESITHGHPFSLNFFRSFPRFVISYVVRRRIRGLPRSRYVQEGQEGVYHCWLFRGHPQFKILNQTVGVPEFPEFPAI
jgi:hypothetical protein